jgi:hypothetical protein
LIGSAIVGVLAVMLLPRGSARAVELGRQQPLQSFGWGALVLIGVPIAATIVGLTLIGLPLSLTLLALYTVALLLAWPAVGLVVGTELARRFSSDRPLHVLGALFLGLIILHLVTHLPVVGGLIACVALIYGLGLVTQSVRRWRRPGSQPVIPTPVAVAA